MVNGPSMPPEPPDPTGDALRRSVTPSSTRFRALELLSQGDALSCVATMGPGNDLVSTDNESRHLARVALASGLLQNPAGILSTMRSGSLNIPDDVALAALFDAATTGIADFPLSREANRYTHPNAVLSRLFEAVESTFNDSSPFRRIMNEAITLRGVLRYLAEGDLHQANGFIHSKDFSYSGEMGLGRSVQILPQFLAEQLAASGVITVQQLQLWLQEAAPIIWRKASAYLASHTSQAQSSETSEPPGMERDKVDELIRELFRRKDIDPSYGYGARYGIEHSASSSPLAGARFSHGTTSPPHVSQDNESMEWLNLLWRVTVNEVEKREAERRAIRRNISAAKHTPTIEYQRTREPDRDRDRGFDR